jgi:hypothetical protein
MDSVQSVQQPPRKRKRLSGEKKYQVLQEIKNSPEKRGEILRREGLYQNDIKRYEDIARDASIKALGQMHPGRKRLQEVPAKEYELLKQEYAIQEKALAGLSVEFMVLKKKVNGA